MEQLDIEAFVECLANVISGDGLQYIVKQAEIMDLYTCVVCGVPIGDVGENKHTEHCPVGLIGKVLQESHQ